jgi:hypothetical protein
VSSIPDVTLENFFKACNEPNEAARLSLLEAAWSENGVFRDGSAETTGRSALSAYLGHVHDTAPGRVLEQTSALYGHGGRRAFGWRLQGPEGSVAAGYAVGEVDTEGRLAVVELFTDATPPEKAKSARQELRAWALANPLAAAGVLVLLVYVVLRLQAERFYHEFGATPEDAGFGPVDLVMRQSSRIILTFALIGIVWSVGYLVGMYPFLVTTMMRDSLGRKDRRWEPWAAFGISMAAILIFVFGRSTGTWLLTGLGIAAGIGALFLPRVLMPNQDAARAQARERVLAWGRFVAVFGTLIYGGWTLAWTGWTKAKEDADSVKAGHVVTNDNFPWRARRVLLDWKGTPGVKLPTCENLVYLGQADDRVLLYDRSKNQTVRVNAGDVQLQFPKTC